MGGRWHACYGSGLSIIYLLVVVVVVIVVVVQFNMHNSLIRLATYKHETLRVYRFSYGDVHRHIECFVNNKQPQANIMIET